MPSYNPYFPASYPMYQPNYQYQTQPVPQVQAQPTSNSSSGLIWVQGEAGAKSYPVSPNTTVMLMDSEGDRFYLKSADASGMPMPLRVFSYAEMPQNQKATENVDSLSSYVTKDEFEAFKAEIRGAHERTPKGRREAVDDE